MNNFNLDCTGRRKTVAAVYKTRQTKKSLWGNLYNGSMAEIQPCRANGLPIDMKIHRNEIDLTDYESW